MILRVSNGFHSLIVLLVIYDFIAVQNCSLILPQSFSEFSFGILLWSTKHKNLQEFLLGFCVCSTLLQCSMLTGDGLNASVRADV